MEAQTGNDEIYLQQSLSRQRTLPTKRKNQTKSSDNDTSYWSPMRWCDTKINGKPPRIKNHTATLVGSKLYVFGGYDGKENHNTIHVLDCSTYEWSTLRGVSGQIPAGRNGHTTTYAQGQLFVIGGWRGKGPLAARDMHIFDIPLKRWIEPETYGEAPGPCNMHSADYMECKNEIVVFRGGDGRAYLNDLHALDVSSLNWRTINPAGRIPVARANHASCVVNDELYIFGGWDGQKRLNDIHVLNVKTEPPHWSTPQNQDHRPQARAGMTLTNVRGKIFLFGGSGPYSKCYDDLHVYDPVKMRWLETVTIENDDNADHGGTVISRNELEAADYRKQYQINQEQALKSTNKTKYKVGVYKEGNPNAEPERADITILRKGPSERSGHTSTLIGRKLLIFGGSHGQLNEYYNDFYELDTDPPPHISVSDLSSTAQFQGSLYRYLNQPQFSDITFIVEGKPVYAHRVVLCLMSERFRAMFSSGFREMREREIVIPDMRYNTFLRMLEYLYSGEPPEILINAGDDRIEQNIFADAGKAVNGKQKEEEIEEDDELSEASSSYHEEQAAALRRDSDIVTETGNDEDEDFEFMQTNYDASTLDGTDMVNAQRNIKKGTSFNEKNIEELVELLEAADQYMLDHLKQACERTLQPAINASNVEVFQKIAERNNATQLYAVCDHFIRNYK